MVYPLLATATINVIMAKQPRPLQSDADQIDTPTRYHTALVMWAAQALLTIEGNPSYRGQLAFASARYAEFVKRAEAEVASWLQ